MAWNDALAVRQWKPFCFCFRKQPLESIRRTLGPFGQVCGEGGLSHHVSYMAAMVLPWLRWLQCQVHAKKIEANRDVSHSLTHVACIDGINCTVNCKLTASYIPVCQDVLGHPLFKPGRLNVSDDARPLRWHPLRECRDYRMRLSLSLSLLHGDFENRNLKKCQIHLAARRFLVIFRLELYRRFVCVDCFRAPFDSSPFTLSVGRVHANSRPSLSDQFYSTKNVAAAAANDGRSFCLKCCPPKIRWPNRSCEWQLTVAICKLLIWINSVKHRHCLLGRTSIWISNFGDAFIALQSSQLAC